MERVITIQRRLRETERTCAVCGKPFMGWGRARFCSPTCRRKWDYQQHANSRRAKRMDRYRRSRGLVDGGMDSTSDAPSS